VFAVEPLTGNPLPVVDGGDLPVALMQRIAREFNQPETTFVMGPTRADADWRLRSFTAKGVEVFGPGGHNSLGAWWWLAAAGRLALQEGRTVLRQEIGEASFPVAIWQTKGALDRIVMAQGAPVAGRQVTDVGPLAESLGLAATDIAASGVPCQVVSTGAAHLMVPIRDRDAVDRIAPDSAKLRSVLEAADGEGCYVFSLDPRQPGATAYARFFGPRVGIPEDPATGTAAGPLAAHLVAHGKATPGTIRIEQGTAFGRTSIIAVEVDAGSISISGRGLVVARGELIV
jgi:trans-2,3-dihydro-3-hydroxyanthranilate isomerase